MNFYSRHGEIDIIANEDGYLVFVEVKYRKNTICGRPWEAVDYRKQQNLKYTASYYMMKKGYVPETPCRFDVVSILGSKISLYKNAFMV